MRTSLLLALLLFSTPAGAALTPAAEKALDEGLTHLYSLEYPESREAFRRLIEHEPDNPFGYLFEAGAIWWQSSQEYGLFQDTPTLQGLFEQDVEAAIRKAELLIDGKSKSERADGHFVEGMALGTRGQWGLMRGHWVKAYFDGRKALKHLKKCSKLDDEYYDVQLGLGVFDYQAARLEGVLRMAALVGVRGNEQRGLDKMHLAMEKGRHASRQAAQFLSTIYIVDKADFHKALPVVERLRAHFPDSAYFHFLEILVRFKLGETETSLAGAHSLFERVRAEPREWNRMLLSLTCGLVGPNCLSEGSVRGARDWFTSAIEAANPAQRQWLSLNRLYRGYAHDLLGQREEAQSDYRWVLAHPPFSDNHARARECLSQPCGKPELLLYLRAMSRRESWPPVRQADERAGRP